MVSIPLILASTTLGCALFGIGTSTNETQAQAEPEPARPSDDPPLTARAEWMDYDGSVNEKYTYVTVVNRCEEGVVVRLTAQWDSGPKCISTSECEHVIEPWFDEYTFYEIRGPKARTLFPPIQEYFVRDTQDLRKPMLWTKINNVRDTSIGWVKQDQLDLKFGERYAFEVGEDCKTLVPREPGQRLHKCYKWHYSAGCGVDRRAAGEPSAEPLLACGDKTTLSVEGDPSSPVCTFETDQGYCRIVGGKLMSTCARR